MNALVFPSAKQEELRRFLTHLKPGQELRLDGISLSLTPELSKLLRQLFEPLAQGKPVHIVPLEAELTTQEAAELLGVSRPYLISLLEKGEIPYRKVGTHRRVKAKDVLDYLERSQKRGHELLDELIQDGQTLGLGY